MRTPDFFIVGAPKCGTSSMHRYLREHPDIFMALGEPKFFAPDLYAGNPREQHAFVRDREAYAALFAAAGSATRVGEATALYLFSEAAPHRIAAVCPNASIIIMLRNPVDVMYAFHAERLHNGNENIFDFREALEAERDRRQGRRIPRDIVAPKALFYRDVARFSVQVERYLSVFGRERIQFILFDDFAQSTEEVYLETLAFLGVPASFRPEFSIWNPSKAIRSRLVWRTLHTVPSTTRRLVEALLPPGFGRAIRNRLRQFNTVRRPRPQLDPDFRGQLLREFSGEIDRLGELIGRDLSSWHRANGAMTAG